MTGQSHVSSPDAPGGLRRLICLLYESLLLIAVLMCAALVYLLLFGSATEPPRRHFFQLYLWAVSAGYFVWNWVRAGQTLAMKTWRIRLEDRAGRNVTPGQALRRYLVASLLFGLSFVWALFDREGLSLHDRLSGTRLVLLPRVRR